MEICAVLLILSIALLFFGLTLGLYQILKHHYRTAPHFLEKALKFNDQAQLSHNSFSLPASYNIKRPSSQPHKEFMESFIDYSKEQPSRNAYASTSNVIDRPRPKEDAEGAQKSDRSIDFLLLYSTRKGYASNNSRTGGSHNKPDHAELDLSFLKQRYETEKPFPDLKEDIDRVEKEISLKTRRSLFEDQLSNEFLHYNYLLALVLRNKKKKPYRDHAVHNASLYLILLFFLSLIAVQAGPDSLKNFTIPALGMVLLVGLLPLVIYSYQHTEENSLLVDMQMDQRLRGEDLADERMNAAILASHKSWLEGAFVTGFRAVGIAGGLAALSNISTFNMEIAQPLFIGFIVVVVLDVILVRNVVIVAMTALCTGNLKHRLLRERVRELIQSRLQPIGQGLHDDTTAPRRLFTIQEPKEFGGSSDNTEVIKLDKTKIPVSLNPRETFGGEDDLEAPATKRGRLMSFNDKEEEEGLEMIQDRKLPIDKNIFKGVEFPESRAELIMMADNISSIDPPSKQDENLTSIKLPTRESVKDNKGTLESERTVGNAEVIDIQEGNEASPTKKLTEPRESTVGLFNQLEEVLNTSFEERQKKNLEKSASGGAIQNEVQIEKQNSKETLPVAVVVATKEIRKTVNQEEARKSITHNKRIRETATMEKARSSSIESGNVAARYARAKRSVAEFRGAQNASASQERKKEETTIPSLLLLSKRPSMINSNTGTTLNSLRDAELDKNSYRNRTNRTLSQGRVTRVGGGYSSETPTSSIPGSLNYLEQDRSSQAMLRFSDYASINSRISLGGESQCEFKSDMENLVKHLRGGDKEGRSESELGDYLEGSLSRFEYKLSAREHKSRDHGLGPIKENGYLSRKRDSKQINETEMEDDILDSAIKGGSDWLSYDVKLKKKRGDRVSLPSGANRSRSGAHAAANTTLTGDQEGKRKMRKVGNSGEYVDPGMNIDKISEISKSYGFRLKHKGPHSHLKDLELQKMRAKRYSSLDKTEDAANETSVRLPKLSRTNNERSVDERRAVQSLKKVPSFPDIQQGAKSQVIM